MKKEIDELRAKLDALREAVRLEERIRRVAELEAQASDPGFWNNANAAKKSLQELENQKSWVDAYHDTERAIGEAATLDEMLAEHSDDELAREYTLVLAKAREKAAALELKKMLDGEDDKNDTILEIHSGAGGTESQDWAEMLLRMYLRYCEKSGFTASIIDQLDGEGAGIKSAAVEVKGPYAFGYLKAEIGVHRLVRISPFDSNARRHTSFASVHALPVTEEAAGVVLNPADLRVDTFRAGGAGGQHVNKTDSAVRMTHLPTGMVAQCQTERSQIKNRESCIKLLTARVAQHLKEEEDRKRDAKAAEKKKIEWGSQIRSYVLHPYNMVKDHRTEVETSDTQFVLDGGLEGFIKAYLLKK